MTLGPKAQLYVVASRRRVRGAVRLHSSLLRHPIGPDWLILAGLTFFSGFFTIKVPKLQARFLFRKPSCLHPCCCLGRAPVPSWLRSTFSSPRYVSDARSREPIRVVFNVGAARCINLGSRPIFYTLSGIRPLAEGHQTRLPRYFCPYRPGDLILCLQQCSSWRLLWHSSDGERFHDLEEQFLWLSVNYFGGASVAALLVSYTQTVDCHRLGTLGRY